LKAVSELVRGNLIRRAELRWILQEIFSSLTLVTAASKIFSIGVFLNAIKIEGDNRGRSSEPGGIAVDRAGTIFVADASKQRVEKLAAAALSSPSGKVLTSGFMDLVESPWARRLDLCR
jgi:hypothetical protein